MQRKRISSADLISSSQHFCISTTPLLTNLLCTYCTSQSKHGRDAMDCACCSGACLFPSGGRGWLHESEPEEKPGSPGSGKRNKDGWLQVSTQQIEETHRREHEARGRAMLNEVSPQDETITSWERTAPKTGGKKAKHRVPSKLSRFPPLVTRKRTGASDKAVRQAVIHPVGLHRRLPAPVVTDPRNKLTSLKRISILKDGGIPVGAELHERRVQSTHRPV
ncbi:hypothetical protein SETIT_5G143800v2 [Setaria italica]|uniref:Uncharacterized protein n=1 Tax=Setaria italica TaxID=4555 RepID=A0A368R4N6_SETIT|nr:hypothetical protein SETIT_5G143800v2 [Setaria italica]